MCYMYAKFKKMFYIGLKMHKCNAQNHFLVILRYFWCFLKKFHEIRNVVKLISQIYYFMKCFWKALKIPQNDKYVNLCITFYAFWAIFNRYFKILHRIWKNLIFHLKISYFMTYYLKRNNKVSMLNSTISCLNQFLPLLDTCEFLKTQN